MTFAVVAKTVSSRPRPGPITKTCDRENPLIIILAAFSICNVRRNVFVITHQLQCRKSDYLRTSVKPSNESFEIELLKTFSS